MMKRTCRIAALAAALLGSTLFFAADANAYGLSFAGGLSGAPGDTITAQLLVDVAGGEDLLAADFGMSFDASKLSFLAGRAGSIWVPAIVDPTFFSFYANVSAPGQVTVSVSNIAPITGVASGVLAELDFQVLPGAAAGPTQLSLANVTLGGDVLGGVLPGVLPSANVAVVPEPAAFWLFAAGLSVLAMWASRRRGQR
jgi:hypothetical protein